MSVEKSPLLQLQEKLDSITLPYEALQYVQSFIARKKKHITANQSSELVFSGAKKLIESNSATDAGALLVWFIESGAGEGHEFHIEYKEIEDNNDLYCDVDRLYKTIRKLDNDRSVLIVEKIYQPLSKILSRAKLPKNSSLLDRITLIEDLFADVLESTAQWQLACKSVTKLQDMDRLAKLLNCWSNEGFWTEKPLYFARAVIQQFAEGNTQLGIKLIRESSEFIDDAVFHIEGCPLASLSVWHLTVIIADLVSLTARPGPDKAKIFKQLSSRYYPIVSKVDAKLVSQLGVIGEKLFGVVNDAPPGLDLLGLLSGAPAAGKGAPQIDMSKIMGMMSQLR
jgi:hypothetical protein